MKHFFFWNYDFFFDCAVVSFGNGIDYKKDLRIRHRDAVAKSSICRLATALSKDEMVK